MIIFGWRPFGEWYQYQAKLAAEKVEEVEEEDVADEVEDRFEVYDVYGCTEYGLDVYGNECPAPYPYY